MRATGARAGWAITAIFVIAAASVVGGTSNATTKIEFEELEHNETLAEQYRTRGVHFPRSDFAVDCRTTIQDLPVCAAASGNKVVRPNSIGEFSMDRIEATFDSPQRSVSVNVRLIDGKDRSALAKLTTYSADGQALSYDTKTIDTVHWSFLEAKSGAPIRSVAITADAGNVGTANFFYADDLSFEAATVPSSPTPRPTGTVRPNARPTMFIADPATDGSVATTGTKRFDIRLHDDVGIDSLSFTSTRTGTASSAVSAPVCGRDVTPCPSGTDPQITKDIAFAREQGEYQVRFRACDAQGACVDDSRLVSFRIPPADPTVRVEGIEVTQGMQTGLVRPDGPGAKKEVFWRPQILRREDIAVRMFVYSTGAAIPGFTGKLQLYTYRADGSSRSYDFQPNVAAITGATTSGPVLTSITADQKPPTADALDKSLLTKRGNITQTLNYVIDKANIGDDVTKVGLLFLPRDARTGSFIASPNGEVQFALGKPMRLGVNLFRLAASGGITPPSNTVVNNDVLRGLREYFPGDVQILSDRSYRWDGDEYFFANACESLLLDLWIDWGEDDVPVKRFPDGRTDIPGWFPTLGVGNTPCAGLGQIGAPDDRDFRFGGTAVGLPIADTLMHEISHTMGMIHASNNHNESGGGDAEPWPYPHGLMGEPLSQFANGNFGAIIRRGTAGGSPFQLQVLDFCALTMAERTQPTGAAPVCKPGPTSAPEALRHELMSYGGTGSLPYANGSRRWPSDRTFSRMVSAVRDHEMRPPITGGKPCTTDDLLCQGAKACEDNPAECAITLALLPFAFAADAPPDQTLPDEGGDAVEALQLAGTVDRSGKISLGPLVTKPVLASRLDEGKAGQLEAFFSDSNGKELAKHRFTPRVIASEDDKVSHHLIMETVKAVPGIARIKINHDGKTVFEQRASKNTPKVQVTSPKSGTSLQGQTTVTWTASDDDGDDLWFGVQYSRDGGKHWEAVGRAGPKSREMVFDPKGFTPGVNGIVRVSASDGMNVASDTSERFELTSGATKGAATGGSPLWLVIVSSVVAVIAAGASTWWRRRRRREGGAATSS